MWRRCGKHTLHLFHRLHSLLEGGCRRCICLLLQPTAYFPSRRGSVEAARELLDLGADVNVENSRGTTPLHFAAAAKSRTRE